MELYETGSANIWSAPHIREQLLAAHLDANSDAASRRPEAIKSTFEWLMRDHPDPGSVVDLGCGPGLYSREFASRGWRVLGIDINRASIRYAKQYSEANGLALRYWEQSYLDHINAGPFDLATCIYCDFGALTRNQQKIFLHNVHRSLATNGEFVFDVFGLGMAESKIQGRRTWTRENTSGFWSPSPCYVMSESQHFESEQVWGEKYIVVPDSGQPQTYVIWTHYFTLAGIEAQLAEAGFKLLESSTEVLSENNFTSNDVMFLRAAKV